MKNKTEYQLEVPFSENFIEIWNIWKEYKWASHKFKYRSIFSEQAALEQLVTLSGGDEEKSVKIIKQSMRREWQGLFPLHETTSENGKSKQSSPKDTGKSVTDSFKDEFMQRNGGGEDKGDGTHLKAV
jgi:hypothetical protein